MAENRLANYGALIAELAATADDPYYSALGKFMDEFSKVEAFLYLLLVSKAGMTMKKAGALLSGVRVEAAISFYERLCEAEASEVPANLKDAFSHAKTLNTARNEVVHYGSNDTLINGRIVSTSIKSHSDKKTRQYAISSTTLNHMTLDARKVVAIIIRQVSPTAQVNEAALKRAWLYKYPANPAQSVNKSGPKGPKSGKPPKGQPKSSQS
jgi:hypothetical protein